MMIVTIESLPHLEFIRDGNPTHEARLAHDLVKADKQIKALTGEKIYQSDSKYRTADDIRSLHLLKVNRLYDLGIDRSEAEKSIAEIGRELEEIGLPSHRAFPETNQSGEIIERQPNGSFRIMKLNPKPNP